MTNYASVNGRLPPAAVCGDYGEPLLSWRVLILPYIEQTDLFNEFRLDEPWDSSHNIKLLKKMPATYAPPGRKAAKIPPNHTVCHVFVGKGAVFEGREGLRYPQDFPDSTSNTFLVVEAGKPVLWTKPENLTYDPDGPLPDLQCIFNDGFRVGMADGARHWVKKEAPEAVLRAFITRNGGKKFPPGWW
jgi:hypothetical protein